MPAIDRRTIPEYVCEYTIDVQGIPRKHTRLDHNVGQYVNSQAHTSGLESFWRQLKCGYHGIYHNIIPKRLFRYIAEFAGRHNVYLLDTEDQMAAVVKGATAKPLKCADLVAD